MCATPVCATVLENVLLHVANFARLYEKKWDVQPDAVDSGSAHTVDAQPPNQLNNRRSANDVALRNTTRDEEQLGKQPCPDRKNHATNGQEPTQRAVPEHILRTSRVKFRSAMQNQAFHTRGSSETSLALLARFSYLSVGARCRQAENLIQQGQVRNVPLGCTSLLDNHTDAQHC